MRRQVALSCPDEITDTFHPLDAVSISLWEARLKLWRKQLAKKYPDHQNWIIVTHLDENFTPSHLKVTARIIRKNPKES